MDEDRDMKIAGQTPAAAADTTSSRLEHHKLNGNTDRAKRLGGLMAGRIADMDVSPPHPRMLATFAVEVTLQRALPDEIVSETALTAFYDTLQLAAPSLVGELQDTGVFSFYYLCVRKAGAGDASEEIGRTFAALAGNGSDAALAREGVDLYTGTCERVRQLAGDMGFIW